MSEAVIVAAVRTPLGRRGKALAGIHPVDLGAHVLNAVIARAGVEPEAVDDVMMGCVSQVGEQSWNVGRNAVLAAGWPFEVPATTVDRQCGSSQQTLHMAAAAVESGQAKMVVAAGVESMSRVPMGSSAGSSEGPDGWPYGPSVRRRFAAEPHVNIGVPVPFNQGISAELVAQKYGIDRPRMDAFALSSHQKAQAARSSGAFAAEIAPVGEVHHDEGIRADATLEALAGLKPAFTEDGMVTAGTSSQISDGASAVLVTTEEHARALGLRPIAKFKAATVVGSDPVIMLDGPIAATKQLLEKAKVSIGDVDTYEVNEAFASIPLAWMDAVGADEAKLNPRGGAIALGHPLGASGARLATTMLHHMQAGGAQLGLQTMCEGGGMANACLLELL
ncbi:thiolase family protein [Natronoglycomyces albus]|uniref:Thiolase family protein n=1 Tax=Natronoglycomyces albus TaxID=2811108 RepID=A0A895XUS0_9ACTN|nr:thiolase family protein [Natronoglycomyces albus]QSB05398.1 thiolase family protein [Natronoglycomyces albus]